MYPANSNQQKGWAKPMSNTIIDVIDVIEGYTLTEGQVQELFKQFLKDPDHGRFIATSDRDLMIEMTSIELVMNSIFITILLKQDWKGGKKSNFKLEFFRDVNRFIAVPAKVKELASLMETDEWTLIY
jgi:hypothetical protein